MTATKNLVATFALGLVIASAGAAFGDTQRSYSAAQVQTIMTMRADGASLAQVARAVGGNRDDVRTVERTERTRVRATAATGGVLALLGIR